MKFILCIDDQPERYLSLSKMLKEQYPNEIGVLVSCRKEDVKFYLDTIKNDLIGVILDHDMPCGLSGQDFVREFFQELNLPILISSHNPVGAEKMMNLLDEYETPNTYYPVKDTLDWLSAVGAFFKISF